MDNNKIDINDKTRISLSVEIPYSRLFIGVVCVIIIAYLSKFIFKLTPSETISLGAAGLIIISLWYNAVNLLYNLKINTINIELRKIESIDKQSIDRKIVSKDLINGFIRDHNEKSIICRDYIEKFNKTDKNPEIIALEVDNDPELRKSLVTILNYFELISISIKESIADDQIIREFFESIFKKYYESYYPFIKKRSVGSAGMPKAFTNFCALSVSYGAKKQQI